MTDADALPASAPRAGGFSAVCLLVDLLLIVAVGLLHAAQLPAAGFLVGLLASLRLAGGPQAAEVVDGLAAILLHASKLIYVSVQLIAALHTATVSNQSMLAVKERFRAV